MALSFLWKRGDNYSAVMNVPKAVQGVLKTRRFVQPLKTSSLAKANLLKLPYLSLWKGQIKAALDNKPEPLLQLVSEALINLQAIKAPDEKRMEHGGHETSNTEQLEDQIREETKAVKEKHGTEVADRYMAVSTGKASFIADSWPTWHDQLEVTAQTKSQHKTAVERFTKWVGRTATIEGVTRRKAGEYVNHLLATSGLSRRSIQRHCSSLSSLWVWYGARGFIDDDINPWIGHKLGKKSKKRFRTGFSNDEILALMTPNPEPKNVYHEHMQDLIRLGLLTGARIEALCDLKPSDIEKRKDGYWISVTGDKTDAGDRTFPLHTLGSPIMERLLALGGKYVFPGFLRGGVDMRRSRFPSRAFLEHRTDVKVTGPGKDFHNLRTTFMSCMEGNEVPESTVKLIVGHKRESMTFGHYSDGQRLELRKQIQRLDYGKEVMAKIKEGA